MVEFIDGSIKAQLNIPDMRIPIQYALSFPKRHSNPFPRTDIFKIGSLEFYQPDTTRFPCLQLAYEALHKGGNAPCILNAANEVAVEAFLCNAISFTDIPDLIEKALSKIMLIQNPTINNLIETDKETRNFVNSLINKKI
jgi:1-deoxy-D-xylulose-5-phosphate reductoisomerase